MLSCLTGENRDIYFPKLDEELNLVTFSNIAEKYLRSLGYEPVQCATEQEARERVSELKAKHQYPVYFFESDTTGEKDFEEFYMDGETLNLEKFESIGIVKKGADYSEEKLNMFSSTIAKLRSTGTWTRGDLVDLFNDMLPEFHHKETGKFLDGRM